MDGLLENQAMKAGDVVRLRSGGPDMTVVGFAAQHGQRKYTDCTWFDSDQKAHRESFTGSALIVVTSAPELEESEVVDRDYFPVPPPSQPRLLIRPQRSLISQLVQKIVGECLAKIRRIKTLFLWKAS